MSNRNDFDRVYNSLINGQRKQAVSQMIENGLQDMPEMLDYFANELNQPEVAIDAAKSYFRLAQ